MLIVQKVTAGSGRTRRAAWTVYAIRPTTAIHEYVAPIAGPVAEGYYLQADVDLVACRPATTGTPWVDVPGLKSEPRWAQPFALVPERRAKPKELDALLERGTSLLPIL